ncbi:DUF4296 domain-containing protein [Myroides sp. WP-1]|uniref:DUF4296 domain-containing protein n=1 Tax=Myroides sp. WP-1 TaxID=2759944 RepID=UPI0015FC8C00|nr:DUF4296 domain-containing protein [Myroides sp. WP-1]MBB1138741.1 DUF4296 domain-containing protein [Myroides sp. WP-1]
MKHILFTFLMAALLCSCQQDKAKPNPFIEESKMEDILYDVTLLYGAQNTNSFAIDTVKSIQMSDIFKKYDIDSLAFVENSRYYIALKKGVYFDMQMRVMNRLKKEQEKLEKDFPQTDERIDLLKKSDSLVEKPTIEEAELQPISTVDTNADKLELLKKNKQAKQKTSVEKKEKFQLANKKKILELL